MSLPERKRTHTSTWAGHASELHYTIEVLNDPGDDRTSPAPFDEPGAVQSVPRVGDVERSFLVLGVERFPGALLGERP